MATGLTSVAFRTFRLVELLITYPTEYNELTDGEKAIITMIISCGRIDMSLGSALRTKIFELFPEGTDIYTDLTEMLSFIPSESP